MNQLNNVKKIFDLFAQQYSDEYIDKDLYNDTLSLFCEHLGKGPVSLLELACGPGNISKNLLAIKNNLAITGLDIAPTMVELARKNVPHATFIVEDVMNIAALNRRFDAVLSGFCYPYLDVHQITKNISMISDCLNPGGHFYISTISGKYEDSKLVHSSSGKGEAIFNYYYDRNLLESILKEHHFTIEHCFYKNRTEKDGSIAKDIIIIARLNS